MAREAGVSTATVSRAFGGSAHVLPETREKVFEAARRLGFHPSSLARALRTGRARATSLVVSLDRLHTDACTAMVACLDEMLAGRGARPIISVARNASDAVRIATELAAAGMCGSLLVDGTLVADSARLPNAAIPIMLFDWVGEEQRLPPGISTVRFDQASAVGQAVQYLVSVGHRNIAFLGGLVGDPESALREAGFRAAMAEACLPVRPEWMFHCDPAHAVDSTMAAFDHATSLSRGRLSALVCASDAIALGAIDAVRRTGRAVPRVVSVTGYGDSLAGRHSTPRLTTVEHDGQRLGRELARIVIAHADDPQAEPVHAQLPARLLLRDSSAPRATFAAFGTIQSPRNAAPAQAPAPASRPVFDDGIYEFQVAHSGDMLDMPYCVNTPGTVLWQWEPLGSTNQMWYIEHAGGGWYTMRSLVNWLYLSVDPHQSTPPVQVDMKNETEPDTQLWRFVPFGDEDNAYSIRSKVRGLAMDVHLAGMPHGVPVIAYPYHGRDNQQWTVRRIAFVTGEYDIVVLHTSMALDATGASCAAGSVPCQAPRARSLSQRWRLAHAGRSRYTITSMLSNLNLQAAKATEPCVVLAPEDADNAAAQHWKIEIVDPTHPSFRIVNEANGLALEVADGRLDERAGVHTAPWADSPHQQWLLFADDI